MNLKPGLRLSSQVCDGEIVVIKGSGEHALECGGAPTVPVGDSAAHRGAPADDLSDGTLLGKRYTNDEETVEILCTKPGVGTLTFDGQVLTLKETKPLPASD
ncbi:MAG TPA: hypothetical protein VII46_02445 [Acidimicrobiales bacterium]